MFDRRVVLLGWFVIVVGVGVFIEILLVLWVGREGLLEVWYTVMQTMLFLGGK